MATKPAYSFRTQYDETPRVRLECPEPSLTQQQFKDDVDINVLLERFKVTGQMPTGINIPTFGDFSQVTDYRTAIEAVSRARDSFMQVPAEIRARFQNDPQRFIEFAADPANLPELRKLGLAKDGGIGGVAPDAKPDASPSS